MNRLVEADEYKQYRRSAVAEIADWHEGFDMTDVSVSESDRKAGSPKAGDKIARNPKNHDDRWLIAADYFNDNFEPIAEAKAEKPVGIVQQLSIAGTPMQDSRGVEWLRSVPVGAKLYTHPSPAKLTDADVDKLIATRFPEQFYGVARNFARAIEARIRGGE